ncbi:MAG TPA: 30S ribosome-binding factor RbfA [Holophagaceae bacterium]|nr:30S ribosome-binding factor RbfA [Holophagaceae bacterium]
MNRPERLEDQLHFMLSTLIQRDLRDPDLGFLTLTAVRLTPDRSLAKVYFTAMGTEGRSDEQQMALARKALGRAAGFLRSAIAPRLHMKRIPELTFFPDTTLEQGNKMDAIFHEIQKERAEHPREEEAIAPETADEPGETQA